MDEKVLCLVFAVVSLYPVINAQWQSGLAIAPAETIRVNVGGTRANGAAMPPPRASPALGAVPAPNPAAPPILGAAPALPARRMAPSMAAGRAPSMAAGLFNQMFGNGFYDEVWSDRFCGMSRSPMGRSFVQEMHGNTNYRCNCRMFSDTFDFQTVDPSPMARRQCMTAVTGVLCCLS